MLQKTSHVMLMPLVLRPYLYNQFLGDLINSSNTCGCDLFCSPQKIITGLLPHSFQFRYSCRCLHRGIKGSSWFPLGHAGLRYIYSLVNSASQQKIWPCLNTPTKNKPASSESAPRENKRSLDFLQSILFNDKLF